MSLGGIRERAEVPIRQVRRTYLDAIPDFLTHFCWRLLARKEMRVRGCLCRFWWIKKERRELRGGVVAVVGRGGMVEQLRLFGGMEGPCPRAELPGAISVETAKTEMFSSRRQRWGR